MNKKEFIEFMVANGYIKTKTAAGEAYDAVFGALRAAIAQGNSVRINKVGNFNIVETAPRVGRNPSTGEPLEIPAKTVVRFKKSHTLAVGVEVESDDDM